MNRKTAISGQRSVVSVVLACALAIGFAVMALAGVNVTQPPVDQTARNEAATAQAAVDSLAVIKDAYGNVIADALGGFLTVTNNTFGGGMLPVVGFDGTNLVNTSNGAFIGGLSTNNFAVLAPGGLTNWLSFVNGALQSVTNSIGGGGSSGPSVEFVMAVDGSNWATVPTSVVYDLGTNDFTIEYWQWIDSLPEWWTGRTVSRGNVEWSTVRQWRLGVTTSGGYALDMAYGDPSPIDVQTASLTGIMTTGTWHHVVYEKTEGASSFYLDGQLMASGYVSGSVGDISQETGLPITIGGANGENFIGKISSVRISNVARYAAPFTPPTAITNDFNTVGLWLLNEGSGTNIVDSSSNVNNGYFDPDHPPTWTTP